MLKISDIKLETDRKILPSPHRVSEGLLYFYIRKITPLSRLQLTMSIPPKIISEMELRKDDLLFVGFSLDEKAIKFSKTKNTASDIQVMVRRRAYRNNFRHHINLTSSIVGVKHITEKTQGIIMHVVGRDYFTWIKLGDLVY